MSEMEKDFDIFTRLFLVVPEESIESIHKDIHTLANADKSSNKEIFNSVYNIYQLYKEAKSSQYMENRIHVMTEDEKVACMRVEAFLHCLIHMYS